MGYLYLGETQMPEVEYRIRPNGDKIAILDASDYEALVTTTKARLVALKQYVSHHSSCNDCYRVWIEVKDILKENI